VESWCGVLEWSLGVECWSGILVWSVGLESWCGVLGGFSVLVWSAVLR
jgi:hypothetical protein